MYTTHMFECCLVISDGQHQDAAQVAHEPHDADAGYEDQLQEILDPTDFQITLASSLATTFRIGKITDVNNRKVFHFNSFLLL